MRARTASSQNWPRSPAVAWLSTRREELGLAVCLIALTLAVYLQVGRFGFIPIDDNLYVTKEAHIRDGLSVGGAAWAFTTFYDCNWIPLTWISLMVDATFYGTSPGGHHLANLALHIANVLLVYAVFARATGNPRRSAFVAALFAVHPLHVESVAWIAERKDVLSLFFGLLALYSYVTYAKGGQVGRLWWAFALYVCSLLSKQTLVTLPCVLLLFDYWPLGRYDVGNWARGLRVLVVEKLPFFALSAAFCVVELVAQIRGHSTRSLIEFPLGTRCLNGLLVYALYLKKALLPFDLAAFYPRPAGGISLAAVVIAAAILATVTWFAIANARRRPFVIVGWFWYLGTLVPMIGVVQVGLQQMADRYTYFPLVGLYVAAAWLVPTLVGAGALRRRILSLAAGGSVAIYATIAFVQVGYWNDGVSLMRRTLAVTADNPYARFALGDALDAQSRTDDAVAEYEHAVRLAPSDPEGHFRLGWVYQGLKEYGKAAEEYRVSLTLDESIATAHNRLGWILWAQHLDAEADREFKRALELDPTNIEANAHLAGLARAQGDFEQSNAYCRRALELDPKLIDYRRLIAFNLRDLGRLDEAISQFESVLAVAPKDAEARTELAHIRDMRGDAPDVVSQRPNAESLRTQGN
jgi:tetratricopeptide (TPR) repeat protein